MLKQITLFPISLTIHEGEGGGAPAAAPAGTTQPADGQQAKPGAKPKVLYGKQAKAQPPAAGENNAQTEAPTKTPEQRKAEFDKLVNEDYKPEFDAFFQQTFDRRFKDHKTTQEKLEATSPLLQLLGAKYNITDGDPKKITDAVNKDNKFFEELADAAGMNVDQYKDVLKLQLDNASLKEKADKADAEQARIQRNLALRQQETALKGKYPDFNLAKLLTGDGPNSRNFADLLNKGIDLEPAFKAAYFDEIASGIVTATGKRVEQNTVSNIQAKGNRPTEAGVASTTGIVVKNDVTKLTRADRLEIARKAARGERIEF